MTKTTISKFFFLKKQLIVGCFSAALVGTPLVFASAFSINQKQIQDEINIPKSSINISQKLKDILTEFVFTNNSNSELSPEIENLVKDLMEQSMDVNVSKEESRKASLSLIRETKENFKDKEVLEEAWYHWFPMAFWKSAYYALNSIDAFLGLIGSLFSHLPLSLDALEAYGYYAMGNLPAATKKTAWISAKLIVSMNANNTKVDSTISNSALLDTIEKMSDATSFLEIITTYLKSLASNTAFYYLNNQFQSVINSLRSSLNISKLKAWANYLYYSRLYWGN